MKTFYPGPDGWFLCVKTQEHLSPRLFDDVCGDVTLTL